MSVFQRAQKAPLTRYAQLGPVEAAGGASEGAVHDQRIRVRKHRVPVLQAGVEGAGQRRAWHHGKVEGAQAAAELALAARRHFLQGENFLAALQQKMQRSEERRPRVSATRHAEFSQLSQ